MTETIINKNRDSQTIERFDFDAYRDCCDATTIGYRKVGLLDDELALLALKDERTVCIEKGRIIIPILVPIDYVAGYDPYRCKQLSKSPGDCYYLSLTSQMYDFIGEDINLLSHRITSTLKSGDSLYFDYSVIDSDYPELVVKLLKPIGNSLTEIDLKDSHAKKDNRQASMALYSYLYDSADKKTDPDNRAKSIVDLYGDHDFNYPHEGVGVYKGNSLTVEIKDKLWTLFKERFNLLGEKHPLSMEDTRQMFEELIAQEGTLTSIYFEGGKPMALGFFLTDIEGCTWLNDKFLKRAREQAGDRLMVFFAGIAAKRSLRYGSMSEKIIKKLVRDVSCLGQDAWLLFEPSNRSERYIPKHTKNFIDNTGLFSCAGTGIIDRHMYEGLIVS